MKIRWVLLLFYVSFVGCSSINNNDSSSVSDAKVLFQKAMELKEKGNYEEALEVFAKVRDQHPYLDYSIESKLEMANIYFKQREYILAQGSYEVFKKLHPNYRSDYVFYQLGLSYYHNLPGAIDRDLSLATKSVGYFQELLTRHPKSEFAKDGQAKLREVQEKLVQKELYIADFYFKQKIYKSALLRYTQMIYDAVYADYWQSLLKKTSSLKGWTEKIDNVEKIAKLSGQQKEQQLYRNTLLKYSQEGYSHLLPKLLFRGGVSAAEVNEKTQSKYYFEVLKLNFPASTEAKKVQKAIQRYEL